MVSQIAIPETCASSILFPCDHRLSQKQPLQGIHWIRHGEVSIPVDPLNTGLMDSNTTASTTGGGAVAFIEQVNGWLGSLYT